LVFRLILNIAKKKMNLKMKIEYKSFLIVLGVLIIDQVVKILVKTNMYLYEDIHVLGNWFQIKFIENDGMAFGLDFPGDYGKLVLSIFRLIASVAIIYYIRHLIRDKAHPGLIFSVSLILAGAVGNIIDSAFYGLIFSDSVYNPYDLNAVAVLFPEGGGYAGFLHGKVVDMFYFPVWKGIYPEWIPWKGGDSFEFFRPVFNIADSAITCGVFIIIIFQKKFFLKGNENEKPQESEVKMTA
jgi:signal peptidase II